MRTAERGYTASLIFFRVFEFAVNGFDAGTDGGFELLQAYERGQ